ncbi:polysaccharide biosynthesis/export family protein [Acetobacter malorum]|uniref:polysaccharide biosynthesis/export family protein n=1 Tax=Acetobacter malorum TaxID=178901 RepID=UPI0039EA20E5
MTKSWARLKIAGTLALCLGSTALLPGCSLPNAGPLAGEMEDTKGVEIIPVTPELALSMTRQLQAEEQRKLTDALTKLANAPPVRDYTLQPGDTVDVALWSFADGTSTVQTAPTTPGPQATKLGTFQIDTAGTITLPYAGRITIAHHTPNAARDIIAHRYAQLGIVHAPDVTINSSASQNGIIVTGSTGEPKVLSWNPGGITLARAITLTLGNGTTTLSENSALDTSTNAISVAIIRQGEEVDLPVPDALNRDIPLRPADKIIMRREPAVQVTVIGGGVSRDGLYGFSKPQSLAATIAGAQGLNPNAANSTRIFVFRQQPDNQKPLLYIFSWKDGNGLIAAQRFPVRDQDIVYVAESPIVPISRVLNTIFQMALPATIAR